MILKIISGALMLLAFYMGLKQGWAMVSVKPAMVDMFGKWNFGKTGIMMMGITTIVGAVLMMIPKTFLWGNFITAAGILLIMAFHLRDQNLKGVAIELPFLLLSLVIIYLQHPLANSRS